MSSDRRFWRPRAGCAFLAPAGVGLALLVLAPAAAAQGSAEAHPALVAPGAALVLTYRIPAPLPVDAGVQERVTCTLQGPDGASAPLCDAPGTLVHVDLAPGEATYAFNVTAPAVPGSYTVTFTRARLVDPLGPVDTSATATFVVRAAEDALTPGGGPAPAEDGGEPAADPDASIEADAQRWLVSTAMGTSALVVMLVGSRWRLGGGP